MNPWGQTPVPPKRKKIRIVSERYAVCLFVCGVRDEAHASHMLGQCSTTELHPQSCLFGFVSHLSQHRLLQHLLCVVRITFHESSFLCVYTTGSHPPPWLAVHPSAQFHSCPERGKLHNCPPHTDFPFSATSQLSRFWTSVEVKLGACKDKTEVRFCFMFVQLRISHQSANNLGKRH
jgi:hypothetical protein